jgi:hypothetical protein
MNIETTETEALEDTLAQGIAAVIAADEQLSNQAELADLFLEELNRLWADPSPLLLN